MQAFAHTSETNGNTCACVVILINTNDLWHFKNLCACSEFPETHSQNIQTLKKYLPVFLMDTMHPRATVIRELLKWKVFETNFSKEVKLSIGMERKLDIVRRKNGKNVHSTKNWTIYDKRIACATLNNVNGVHRIPNLSRQISIFCVRCVSIWAQTLAQF